MKSESTSVRVTLSKGVSGRNFDAVCDDCDARRCPAEFIAMLRWV